MDILTHILSGGVIGTVVASSAGFKLSKRVGVMLTGMLGGAFPDIDAISMWSRFDGTFGKLFGFSHTGRAIYGAKFWYSHHAFFHSVAASVLFGLLFAGIAYLIYRFRSSSKKSFIDFFRKNIIFFCAFVLGCWMHLLGDLPTPASVWGGIRLFWPMNDYVGGFGKIWWWNNYDIFLILLICFIVNSGLLLFSGFIKSRIKYLTGFLFVAAFFLIVYQMNNREIDYAYTGNTTKYTTFEEQSKKEQERILGKKMYHIMDAFDRKVKINF